MLPDSTQECEKNAAKMKGAEGSKRKEQSGTKMKAPPPSTLPPPLVRFVEDPREMIDQLFQAIGKEELAASLPTILQSIPFDELKQLCLEQLQQMPRDVIARILSGTEEPQPSDQSPDSTSADKDETSRRTNEGTNKHRGCHVYAPNDSSVVPVRGTSPSPSESLELFAATEDMELLLHEDVGAKDAARRLTSPPNPPSSEKSGDLASSLTRMQMEILELELRARAIKALLKSQRGSEDGEEGEKGGAGTEPPTKTEPTKTE